MTSHPNRIIAKAIAVALATTPFLTAVTLGALLDGHSSIAAAANGGGGNGDGGNGNGGGNANGGGNGNGNAGGNAGDDGDSGGHGKSADKGDVDGDGTPGRSGTNGNGIGKAVSEVAKDDSTTGQQKAEAIHAIERPNKVVEDEGPLDR